MARHAEVAAGFAALAIVWTLPLPLHLSTHLPGPAIGDNAIFLWDFWWMRQALASHANVFHTPYLFAPVGANLTLHTHTALPAFVGATLLRPLSPVAALNAVTLAGLALNGFCAYLLAWRVTRDRAASIVTGVVFGCCPFVAAHLIGHFNLTHAWTIPLFALAWLAALQGGKVRWAIAAGVILAATAYVDYYFLVYDIAFAACTWLMESRWLIARTRRAPRWVLAAVALLALVDVGIIIAISMTGGFSARLGSTTIEAHSLFNPLQALGALLILIAGLCLAPAFRVSDDRASNRRMYRAALLLVAVSALLVAPLAWESVELVRRGDYASPAFYWRSGPPGIDAATLLLGHPFHGLWGGSVHAAYARLGIDPVESIAWLGIVPAFLALATVRRRWDHPDVRRWAIIGIVFLIWSFGSHLFVAGFNTALLMPAAVLQLLPIVANARMPGRAMVVVYLAMATLAGVAVADQRTRRAAMMIPILIVAFVFIEFCAAPFPMAPVDCPAVYQTLGARAEPGAVAELPMAFGDGFGEYTATNGRTMLACQTVHGRPLVGGFVSRMSPGTVASYRSDPLLAMWMRLSGAVGFDAMPPADRITAADRLRADAIAFILVDRANASEALQAEVSELPVRKISDDGRRALYLVEN